ncbi:hypothetical protein GCM10010176_036330 [Nonomuraea spiralis]|nr:hypothetical protein GCM10010176_036330 [Nonomuraea spiralis]
MLGCSVVALAYGPSAPGAAPANGNLPPATPSAAALAEAKAAESGHLTLDGTVIRTDRISTPGPNGADLWWSGKYEHHGGNIQVLSDPSENVSPAIRTPAKKPKNAQLTDEQKAYDQVIRGVHAIAERANSLLKTTCKALRRASLDPWRIGAIVAAALVILRLGHSRHA